MKIAKRIIIGLSLLIIVVWIVLNYSAWHCGTTEKIGSFTTDEKDAIKNNSIIAVYKENRVTEKVAIRLERMEIRIPWKYIFYTPKFYSNEFYINPNSLPANTKYIMVDNDTVMKNCVPPLRQLPSRIKVYFENDTNSVDYFLDQKYQENIDNVASVSFIEKIDSGPFLNED